MAEKKRDQVGVSARACAEATDKLDVVHWTSIGSYNVRLGRVRPKNRARLVAMMLDVLSFPSNSNDVVNSLEMMERKIKEFETHVNIDMPLRDNMSKDDESKEVNTFEMDEKNPTEK